MPIGELAKKSGLSIDTIRFYEKKGLIDSAHIRRKSNNYRDYSNDSIERLRSIQRFKRLGFTLAEIQAGIQSFESDLLTKEQKKNFLVHKLTKVYEQIQEMEMMRIHLLQKIDLLGC
jgi:MerR family transcriptional regulator, copper efflux regulator